MADGRERGGGAGVRADVGGPGGSAGRAAGRKKLAEADPGLVPAMLALVEDSRAGDPQSPLRVDDQERGAPGR